MKDRRYFATLVAEIAVVAGAIGIEHVLGKPYGDFARDLILMSSIVVFAAMNNPARAGKSHLLLLAVQAVAVAILAYGLQFWLGEPHGESVRTFVVIGFVVLHFLRLARQE